MPYVWDRLSVIIGCFARIVHLMDVITVFYVYRFTAPLLFYIGVGLSLVGLGLPFLVQLRTLV